MTRPPHGGCGTSTAFFTLKLALTEGSEESPFYCTLEPAIFSEVRSPLLLYNGKLSCLTFPEEMSKRHYDSCWIDFENFFTDQPEYYNTLTNKVFCFFRQLIIVRSKVERGWVIFYTLYKWCASNGNLYISGIFV